MEGPMRFGYAEVVALERSSFPERPDDVRFSAAAADGQARAVVDGTGRLIEVNLDARLLRRTALAVGEAVLAAVTQAQETARVRAAEQLADVSTAFDPPGLAADLDAADLEAERRLSELRVIVADLVRHTGRP
jgi:DNA-binding protein YbaB